MQWLFSKKSLTLRAETNKYQKNKAFMKTDTSTQEYAEMARQAQELEAACANAKPERLPRHELFALGGNVVKRPAAGAAQRHIADSAGVVVQNVQRVKAIGSQEVFHLAGRRPPVVMVAL